MKRNPTKPAVSFVVVHGDLCFLFTPDTVAGGYSVKALNRQGVNTQGDTFEEALAMGIEAAQFMADCEAAPCPRPRREPQVKPRRNRRENAPVAVGGPQRP